MYVRKPGRDNVCYMLLFIISEFLAYKLHQMQQHLVIIQNIDTLNLTQAFHDALSEGFVVLLCGVHCVRKIFTEVLHRNLTL